MLIRKLRLQRGWSQEQLAELTGLSVRTIQRVERGYLPSLETRNALAAVFEIELSNFDFEEQEMNEEQPVLKSDEAKALQYVQGIKAFYSHFFFYTGFTGLFIGAFYLKNGFIADVFYFMMFGWGLGVLFHGLNAYEVFNFFGPEWEKRKVEKRLGRKL